MAEHPTWGVPFIACGMKTLKAGQGREPHMGLDLHKRPLKGKFVATYTPFAHPLQESSQVHRNERATTPYPGCGRTPRPRRRHDRVPYRRSSASSRPNQLAKYTRGQTTPPTKPGAPVTLRAG